jgi:hypothetical protein
MSRTTEDFLAAIDREARKPVSSGYSEYGSKVMPMINIYKALETFDQRKAFQDAIEHALRSSDDRLRNFAVDLCLGFFVFRTVS